MSEAVWESEYIRVTQRQRDALKRWKYRRSKGRHTVSHCERGRRRRAGILWEWRFGWAVGPSTWITKRARRTVGLRKPKYRGRRCANQ